MPEEPKQKKAKLPILVTCGLPYANGPLHVGHLRTYVPGDIFVRTMRKLGHDVTFVCGSDTHGTPIIVNAEELGIRPKELVERYHKHFEETFSTLGINFDNFGSTDDEENHIRTQETVRILREKGFIYPKSINLAYCPKCKRFLPDRYVEGTCPYCGSLARGDECDMGCGRHLEPGEIKSPLCKVCKSEAVFREQEHYFFRLSTFRDFLVDFLEKMGGTANARNYAKEWVLRELKDWCITRNLEWGVNFPGTKLVVYVWVDAPIGYISFTPDWEKIWHKPSKIIHFIGGDIIYHHCVFWPALLKGADYTLPSAVVASGMVTVEGNKFSKSRGYVVWVKEDYLDMGFHPDLLRYYLASYTSHTRELNFSWKVFQEKVNNELVGILGNFIYRVLSFAYKNFEGKVPDGKVDGAVYETIEKVEKDIKSALEEYDFKKMTDAAMYLAIAGNTEFQSKEPWHLIKKDKKGAEKIVKNCMQLIKALCIFFEPVMPEKMGEAWKQLGMEGDVSKAPMDDAKKELPSGQDLRAPQILFGKIEDEKIKEAEKVLGERLAASRK
jgi:methionyl-tRNA synthetase